jgi:hypothetical protein
MHVPISVKSPNNISKWQMGFNSAFKWLMVTAELQADNAIYFQRKIQLPGFSAYPDGSPSPLILIGAFLL